MKSVPAAIICLALSVVLAIPAASGQKRKKAAPPAPAVSSPLDPTLADLERVNAATQSDLADLKNEKRSFNWKTAWRFWHRESAHSQRSRELAESLQRNLHDALPGLVQDARAGSFKATFKLYNDLSVVCELLDSLVDSVKADSKKGEGPLVHDSAAMGRIRQDLATFLEQKAAALDAAGTPPYAWTSASAATNGKPKKIIVDDNIPSRKPVVKKTAAVQQ